MSKRLVSLLIPIVLALLVPSQALAKAPEWSPDEEFAQNESTRVPAAAIVPETALESTPELVPAPEVATAAVPSQLDNLIEKVKNGQPDTAAGIYSPDLFALRIVPQPAGNPAFVSSVLGTVTEFSVAAQNGTIGLLAHNYLSGKRFSDLTPGDEIDLVKGDGTVVAYSVTETRHFQALEPTNPYSNFADLDNGSALLSSTDLFNQMYGAAGTLVLQTCIKADGNASWGRLFVIAQPAVQ